ncbi:hypothetical protein PAMP_013320 [Pampus punctatissimus]
MESKSASLPETIISSTAKPNNTIKQLTTAHVLHRQTEMQPATRDLTHSPAEVSVPATAVTAGPAPAETAGPAPAETAGPAPAETAVPAPAETAGPATAETAGPATAPATTHATVSSETLSVSSTMSTSITKLDVTIKLYSPTVSENSTQAIQNSSSPSTFSTTETTTNTTSEASYVYVPESISSTVTIHETTTASTAVSSTSQPVSATRNHMISTSYFPDKTRLSSTTESPTSSVLTDSASSTTVVYISPAGTLIPHIPKRLPIPTTKSTPATTTAPQEASKSPLDTVVQPCSIRGVVKHCLITIATLAGLATIFIVTTIVLCTRLSAKKYKVKRPQQETEMMCISALLPERTYTRQRNHVFNGVRVIPRDGDSDEEGTSI